MRCKFLLSTLFLAATLPGAAHADTVDSFMFTAQLDPGSASGTLNVDTTTGVITGGDFTFSNGTTTYTVDGAPVSAGSFGAVDFALFLYSGGYFQITAPGDTGMVGYQGGPLCASDMMNGCFSVQTPNVVYPTGLDINGLVANEAVSGSLTPSAVPSATPEPSSLLMLGTGMIGVMALTRRRLLIPVRISR